VKEKLAMVVAHQNIKYNTSVILKRFNEKKS